MERELAIGIAIIIGAIITPFVKTFFNFIKSLINKKQSNNDFVTRCEFTEKCKELRQEFISEFNAVEGKLSRLDEKVDSNHTQTMNMFMNIQNQIQNVYQAIIKGRND